MKSTVSFVVSKRSLTHCARSGRAFSVLYRSILHASRPPYDTNCSGQPKVRHLSHSRPSRTKTREISPKYCLCDVAGHFHEWCKLRHDRNRSVVTPAGTSRASRRDYPFPTEQAASQHSYVASLQQYLTETMHQPTRGRRRREGKDDFGRHDAQSQFYSTVRKGIPHLPKSYFFHSCALP